MGVTKGLVHGGLLLSGDDFSNAASRDLVARYLASASITAAARHGRAFRPWLEGPDASGAAPIFVDLEGRLLALFNYLDQAQTFNVDLLALGFRAPLPASWRDLWTDHSPSNVPSSGRLKIQVSAHSATVVVLEPVATAVV